MASGEEATPYKNLTETYQHTYMLQPTKDKNVGHMDQITFHTQIITDSPMLLKPGTTVLITSSLAPAPYVPDGLYSVKDNNLVQLTMRNTDVRPFSLPKNKPTIHLLDYYEEVPISKDTLRTYFLSQEIGNDTTNPTHNGDEPKPQDVSPKQHLENIQQKLRHATSLLDASELDPPGNREKPPHYPSPAVRRILLDQCDTKDIEQAWIPLQTTHLR